MYELTRKNQCTSCSMNKFITLFAVFFYFFPNGVNPQYVVEAGVRCANSGVPPTLLPKPYLNYELISASTLTDTYPGYTLVGGTGVIKLSTYTLDLAGIEFDEYTIGCALQEFALILHLSAKKRIRISPTSSSVNFFTLFVDTEADIIISDLHTGNPGTITIHAPKSRVTLLRSSGLSRMTITAKRFTSESSDLGSASIAAADILTNNTNLYGYITTDSDRDTLLLLSTGLTDATCMENATVFLNSKSYSSRTINASHSKLRFLVTDSFTDFDFSSQLRSVVLKPVPALSDVLQSFRCNPENPKSSLTELLVAAFGVDLTYDGLVILLPEDVAQQYTTLNVDGARFQRIVVTNATSPHVNPTSSVNRQPAMVDAYFILGNLLSFSASGCTALVMLSIVGNAQLTVVTLSETAIVSIYVKGKQQTASEDAAWINSTVTAPLLFASGDVRDNTEFAEDLRLGVLTYILGSSQLTKFFLYTATALQRVSFLQVPLLSWSPFCSDSQVLKVNDFGNQETIHPQLRLLTIDAPQCIVGVISRTVTSAVVSMNATIWDFQVNSNFDDIIVTSADLTGELEELRPREKRLIIHNAHRIGRWTVHVYIRPFRHLQLHNTLIPTLEVGMVALYGLPDEARSFSLLQYDTKALEAWWRGSVAEGISLTERLFGSSRTENITDNDVGRISASAVSAASITTFTVVEAGGLKMEVTPCERVRLAPVALDISAERAKGRLELPSLTAITVMRRSLRCVLIHGLPHLAFASLDTGSTVAFLTGSSLQELTSAGVVTHFPSGYREQLRVNGSWTAEDALLDYYFSNASARAGLLMYDVPQFRTLQKSSVTFFAAANHSMFAEIETTSATLVALVLIKLPNFVGVSPIHLRNYRLSSIAIQNDDNLRLLHVEDVPLTFIAVLRPTAVTLRNISGLIDLAMSFDAFDNITILGDCNNVAPPLVPNTLSMMCQNVTLLIPIVAVLKLGRDLTYGMSRLSAITMESASSFTVVGSHLIELSISAPNLRHMLLKDNVHLTTFKALLQAIEMFSLIPDESESAVVSDPAGSDNRNKNSNRSVVVIGCDNLLFLDVHLPLAYYVHISSATAEELSLSLAADGGLEMILLTTLPKVVKLTIDGAALNDVAMLSSDPCRAQIKIIQSTWLSSRRKHFALLSGLPSITVLTLRRVNISLIAMHGLSKLKNLSIVDCAYNSISASANWETMDTSVAALCTAALQSAAPLSTMFHQLQRQHPVLLTRPGSLILMTSGVGVQHLDLSRSSFLSFAIFDEWETVQQRRLQPSGVMEFPSLTSLTMTSCVSIRKLRIRDSSGKKLKHLLVDGCSSLRWAVITGDEVFVDDYSACQIALYHTDLQMADDGMIVENVRVLESISVAECSGLLALTVMNLEYLSSLVLDVQTPFCNFMSGNGNCLGYDYQYYKTTNLTYVTLAGLPSLQHTELRCEEDGPGFPYLNVIDIGSAASKAALLVCSRVRQLNLSQLCLRASSIDTKSSHFWITHVDSYYVDDTDAYLNVTTSIGAVNEFCGAATVVDYKACVLKNVQTGTRCSCCLPWNVLPVGYGLADSVLNETASLPRTETNGAFSVTNSATPATLSLTRLLPLLSSSVKETAVSTSVPHGTDAPLVTSASGRPLPVIAVLQWETEVGSTLVPELIVLPLRFAVTNRSTTPGELICLDWQCLRCDTLPAPLLIDLPVDANGTLSVDTTWKFLKTEKLNFLVNVTVCGSGESVGVMSLTLNVNLGLVKKAMNGFSPAVNGVLFTTGVLLSPSAWTTAQTMGLTSSLCGGLGKGDAREGSMNPVDMVVSLMTGKDVADVESWYSAAVVGACFGANVALVAIFVNLNRSLQPVILMARLRTPYLYFTLFLSVHVTMAFDAFVELFTGGNYTSSLPSLLVIFVSVVLSMWIVYDWLPSQQQQQVTTSRTATASLEMVEYPQHGALSAVVRVVAPQSLWLPSCYTTSFAQFLLLYVKFQWSSVSFVVPIVAALIAALERAGRIGCTVAGTSFAAVQLIVSFSLVVSRPHAVTLHTWVSAGAYFLVGSSAIFPLVPHFSVAKAVHSFLTIVVFGVHISVDAAAAYFRFQWRAEELPRDEALSFDAGQFELTDSALSSTTTYSSVSTE